MKRSRLLASLFLVPFLLMGITASGGENRNFVTALSGDEEVPARDTQARGVAIFHLSKDGTELAYKLIVANIENVTAAHIHFAAPGVNGAVVVPLSGNAPPGGGRTDGILAEGILTSANFTGSLAGQEMSVLIARMEAGDAYVNVHTNDGVPPTNTGPGDFPGGEIRGQIK